jgi:hypothetical protein
MVTQNYSKGRSDMVTQNQKPTTEENQMLEASLGYITKPCLKN